MRRSVIVLLNEAKQKMSGYVALFTYRLMNLCVKAEPASLLSIELKDGNQSIGLDVIAEVGQTDDFHFIIIPKDESFVKEIIKAIVKVHPEFQYEIKKVDENANEDDESESYLLVGMPVVNEDRRDVMNDSVSLLYDECKTRCNLLFDKYLAEINAKLLLAKDDEKKEGKEALEKLHSQINEMMDGYKERKLAEIEEGYQRYLNEKEEGEREKESREKAHGKTAGKSMKLFGEEDE